MKPGLLLSAALTTLLVTACATATQSPSPIASATHSEGVTVGDPLPTLAEWPLASNWGCAGVGMEPPLTVQGSPSEGVYALWQGSKHVPITWPPGYRVSYQPTLTIRAPGGTVVATAGTDLTPERLPGLLVCLEVTVIEMFPITSPYSLVSRSA